MHYRRWLRWGDPLHKRRNRGVIDAPICYPLGPAQAVMMRTLYENPGRVFPWYALGQTRYHIDNVVKKLRDHYGADCVETCLKPRGYRMSPQFAEKLAARLGG